jgi:hypothetical protein
MRFDASEHEKSVATGIFPDFAALTVAVASTIPEPRGWVGLLGENGCTFCWIRVRISAVVKGLGATDCASATTVQLEEKRVPHGATTVGIDLGLKTMATYSDGTEFAPQKWYRESEQAPGIAQRARKKRRVKAIHARIANQRKDAIHKETTALVKAHAAIFVGDVNESAGKNGYGEIRTRCRMDDVQDTTQVQSHQAMRGVRRGQRSVFDPDLFVLQDHSRQQSER